MSGVLNPDMIGLKNIVALTRERDDLREFYAMIGSHLRRDGGT